MTKLLASHSNGDAKICIAFNDMNLLFDLIMQVVGAIISVSTGTHAGAYPIIACAVSIVCTCIHHPIYMH